MATEGHTPDGNLSWMVENLLDKAAEAEKAVAAKDNLVLATRARELAVQQEALAAAAGDVYLTFVLGDEKFTLAAAVVEEVMPAPRVTPVLAAPPVVVGLFSRRGTLYAAMDGKRLLGGTPSNGGRYALVLRGGPLSAALVVDDITGAFTFDPAAVRPTDLPGSVVRGIAVGGERVLDAQVLWTSIVRALGLESETK